jgi:hypothetical protein
LSQEDGVAAPTIEAPSDAEGDVGITVVTGFCSIMWHPEHRDDRHPDRGHVISRSGPDR